MKKHFKAEKRKQTFILTGIFAVVVAGYLIIPEIFGGKKKNKEIPKVKVFDKKKEQEESFKALYGDKLNSVVIQVEGLKKENEKLKKLVEKLEKEKRNTSVKNNTKAPQPPANNKSSLIIPPPPPQVGDVSLKPKKLISKIGQDITGNPIQPVKKNIVRVVVVKDAMDVRGFYNEEKPKKVKTKKKDKIKTKILPGSFVKARILNGFNAYTGFSKTGKPSPVTLILTDVVQLPNDYTLDLRNCFLKGSATGDLSSKRAKIRVEEISCINDKGEAIVKKVNGSVNGPDGQEGILGKVVYKQTEVLRNSVIAGALEGISKVMQQQSSAVSISPQGLVSTVKPSQAGSAALFGGAESMSKTLSNFYGKILDLTFPVVDIPAGVPVEVLFLSSVDIKDISKGEKE